VCFTTQQPHVYNVVSCFFLVTVVHYAHQLAHGVLWWWHSIWEKASTLFHRAIYTMATLTTLSGDVIVVTYWS
jgi:hypothetical protein